MTFLYGMTMFSMIGAMLSLVSLCQVCSHRVRSPRPRKIVNQHDKSLIRDSKMSSLQWFILASIVLNRLLVVLS